MVPGVPTRRDRGQCILPERSWNRCRRGHRTPGGASGASVEERANEVDVKSILAPIDFSDSTEAVASTACTLARAFGAKLWLVHVAAPEPDFVGYEVGPQSVRDQRAGHLREEHRRLQELAEAIRDDGVDTAALLIQGPTVAKILSEAERVGADLIVLGSHGHGAVYRTLLGSVSESVLRQATCPVTVVPHRVLIGDRGRAGTS